MRIRTPDGVSPFFLGYQMCASDFRQRMEKVKKATTSVAAVYQKDLLPLAIALPPESEQIRIVAEVDRHLSIIREVEAEVDANLQRAHALRQATLAKVFSYS
jgi:type I restriction enzyme S subunit